MYYSVSLAKLWQLLEVKEIPPICINTMEQLYDDMMNSINIGQKVTDGTKMTKGRRQVCCIAPTLLKIYLEQILKIWGP